MEDIKQSFGELRQFFVKNMADFDAKRTTPVTGTEPWAADYAAFKAFITASLKALQAQIEWLAKETDQLEMRSRRKILLLHGVPEEQQEDAAAVVAKTVTDRLKLTAFTAGDISRCHRMGRIANPDRPRPILFKLREDVVRAKIWSAKTTLKGSGITVSEFLTKARHDVFMAARQRFGVAQCWTREGYVYVLGSDGTRRRVSCIADLDAVPQKAKAAGKTTAAVTAAAKETAVPTKASRRAAAKK